MQCFIGRKFNKFIFTLIIKNQKCLPMLDWLKMHHQSKNVTKAEYDEDTKLGVYLNNQVQGFVRIFLFIVMSICRNTTLAKCGGEAQHSQSWGFGILRDSQMCSVQQQGPKHLALGCSWCHWKGLEEQISNMASDWSFGHMQPKLWAKEGPGVKLAV